MGYYGRRTEKAFQVIVVVGVRAICALSVEFHILSRATSRVNMVSILQNRHLLLLSL